MEGIKSKEFWQEYTKYNVCLSLLVLRVEFNPNDAIEQLVEITERWKKFVDNYKRYDWEITIDEKRKGYLAGTIRTLTNFSRHPNLVNASKSKKEEFNQVLRTYHEIITWLNGEPFSEKQEKKQGAK